MRTDGLKKAPSTRQIFAAFFIYAALAVLFFLPSLGSMTGSLIGPPEDNMFILWSLWYGSGSLAHAGSGLMHTHHLYYPDGISLFFSNYYYYGVALTFFLRMILALPLIYNLLVLHTFVLAGLGAFFLVFYLTEDFVPSLLGGFIFAFNPSHFGHSLHHLTVASIQFVPFFMLFLIRSARIGKKSDIFWASFFMTLDALCDWNFLVFDLLFLLLVLIYLIFKNRKNAGVVLKRIIPVPFISFLCLSPLFVPMLYIGFTHSFLGKLPGHDIFVADLAGFLTPDPYHLLYRLSGFIRKLNGMMTGNDWEKTVYLGLVNLLLVLSMIGSIWKQNRKYFFGLLAFMILAMGVRPHFLGQAWPIPLPYRLIQEMPFLTQARNPSRIIVYAYLFWAILVAFSVKEIFLRLKSGVVAKILVGILLLLVFLDFYSVSSAMTPVTIPPCYDTIRRDPDKNFGILELPWDGARYMMYQTIHGIPSVQGYMGRRVERTLSDRLSYDFNNLGVQKKMLIENHVKYIVIFKHRLIREDTAEKDLNRQIVLNHVASIYSKTYETIYEDGDCVAYKVY